MRSLIILLGFFPFVVAAQVTHLDTLRHLDLRPGGGYSAVWGYTAPNGREYALIGLNGNGGQPAGTSIVDITDNTNMQQVGFVLGPPSSWREMKTWRHYAYIVSENSAQGLQVVDLSYLPDSVHLVRSIFTIGPKNVSHSHTITVSDGYLYLNGGTSVGITIYSLADPENPVYVGEYQPEYIHDSYVLRDTIYASAIYSTGGVYIADARNKGNVQFIGKITYTGSGTHNAWVTKDRRFVVTTDEIGGITPKQLQFWDISNLPTIPTVRTSAFTPSPADIVHNVTIRGNYAYVAWYSLGVVVVNIAIPESPSYAGGYDTSTQPPGGYAGIWGVYPYFPSGKIVAGDMQNGLWVFSFSDLAPRVPVTLLEPEDGDSAGASGSIGFRWRAAADQTEDPHYYKLHIAGPGVDTLLHSNDTAYTLANLPGFQAGQTYRWHVWIADEFTEVTSQDTFQFIFITPPVSVREKPEQPLKFSLEQNYPNPFNPITKIRFSIPLNPPFEKEENGELVTLKIYNLLGKEVATLVNEMKPPGTYIATWDASEAASGVYFYRLIAGGFSEVRKMILLR